MDNTVRILVLVLFLVALFIGYGYPPGDSLHQGFVLINQLDL